MNATMRSELLKQRSTRTNLIIVTSLVGIVLLIAVLHVVSFSTDDLAQRDNQFRIVGLGTAMAALFASLLGAISITGEIRHGTIRPTFLATPRRERVIAAKACVAAIAGLLVGLIAEALTAGVVSLGLAARDVAVHLDVGDYGQLIIGGACAAALFGVLGLGIGAVVRNQVAAVVALCVWLLFIEPILLGDVPAAGRLAPEAAAGAIAGAIQTQVADTLVSPAVGVILLAGYAAVALFCGLVSATRRDVS